MGHFGDERLSASPHFGRYQIILPGDSGTCVCDVELKTTYPLRVSCFYFMFTF